MRCWSSDVRWAGTDSHGDNTLAFRKSQRRRVEGHPGVQRAAPAAAAGWAAAAASLAAGLAAAAAARARAGGRK